MTGNFFYFYASDISNNPNLSLYPLPFLFDTYRGFQYTTLIF